MMGSMRYLVVRCRSKELEEFIQEFLEKYVVFTEAPAKFEYPIIVAMIHNMVVVGVEKGAAKYARAAMADIRGCYTVKSVGTMKKAKRLAYTLVKS